MSLKHKLRRIVNKIGLDIHPYPYMEQRSKMIALSHFNINLIFDIGANYGLYALELRELGYDKKIVSFEPLNKVYASLKKTASKDSNWKVDNIALGNKDGEDYINISKNTHSSSILNTLPLHTDAAPESVYIDKQKIIIKRLDSIFSNYYESGDNVFLKIDTQGFEKYVLEGAENSLANVSGIQLEMSLTPLYEGTPLYLDMIEYMDKRGFQLFALENGFGDHRNGQQLQIDGTFYRKELI